LKQGKKTINHYTECIGTHNKDFNKTYSTVITCNVINEKGRSSLNAPIIKIIIIIIIITRHYNS
jgi:hypothetical protein